MDESNPQEAFKIAVEELRVNYGKENFPKEKIALLWEKLKSLRAKDILTISRRVMEETPFPPVLAHFIPHIEMLKEQERIDERQKERAEEQWEWNSCPPEVKSKLDQWKKTHDL